MKARVQLDQLFDKFRQDVDALIDNAVEEERDRLLRELKDFIVPPAKSPKKIESRTIITPPPNKIDLPSVRDIERAERLERPNRPCGTCVRKGSPCFRHGGTDSRYQKKQSEVELDPRQRYCVKCRKEPINRMIYKSDHFCSQLCSGRWSAVNSLRKRKGLPLYIPEPLYEPDEDKTDSNRPLIEFVGKRKTKAISLPEPVIHKSNKSYADHLRETGQAIKKEPKFRYEDRHEKEPTLT